MSIRRHLPALLALLVVSACGSADPSAGITVTTDKSSYTTTDPVMVTITNTTGSKVLYSSCPERWEHKVGDSYTRVEELQQCLAGFVPLPAGESATIGYTFPEGQPAGTWRIPIPIASDVGGNAGEVRTGDFTIDG